MDRSTKPTIQSSSGSDIWQAISLFFVNRLGLIFGLFCGLMFLPLNSGWRVFSNNLFLDGLVRWDSGWYHDIAVHGYTNLGNSQGQRDTAFFPLYPLIVHLVNFVIRDTYLAGLIVSLVAGLLAAILFVKLVRKKFGSAIGQTSLWLWLVFPFSFYLSAMYTEGLFALLVIAAFYFAEHKRWLGAALCVALASATRAVGIIAGLGILLIYLEQINYNWRKIRADILWLALCPLGLVAYIIYLWRRFREPFAFIASQHAADWAGSWKIDSSLPAHGHRTLAAFFNGDWPINSMIQIGLLIVALGLLVGYWRRLTIPYTVWALATILISLSAWKIMGRTLTTTFPVFIAAAFLVTDKPKWRDPIIYLSTIFLALFALVFSHWFWAAG